MHNNHENVLDLVDNTSLFYNVNKEEINTVEVLIDSFANLEALYKKITEDRVASEMVTSPFTELKEETKDRVAFIANAHAGPLLYFAKANKLTAILTVVSASPTFYKQGRSKVILSRLDTLRFHYAEQLPGIG